MSIIRKRSATSHYKTVQQYANDWRLMFNNARQYNQEGSWVVNDANELQKAFEAEFARQTNGTDLPGMGNASGYDQFPVASSNSGGGGGNGSGYAQPTPAKKKKKQQPDWSDDDYGSD